MDDAADDDVEQRGALRREIAVLGGLRARRRQAGQADAADAGRDPEQRQHRRRNDDGEQHRGDRLRVLAGGERGEIGEAGADQAAQSDR